MILALRNDSGKKTEFEFYCKWWDVWNKNRSILYVKYPKTKIIIIPPVKLDNDVTLGGIEFDLIDSNKNVVRHLTTDADGEARIDNINIGNYMNLGK